MDAGLRSVGYQVLVCTCEQCGHTGHVDPQKVQDRAKLKCRKCGSRRCEMRLVWWQGRPPANIVFLNDRKRKP